MSAQGTNAAPTIPLPGGWPTSVHAFLVLLPGGLLHVRGLFLQYGNAAADTLELTCQSFRRSSGNDGIKNTRINGGAFGTGMPLIFVVKVKYLFLRGMGPQILQLLLHGVHAEQRTIRSDRLGSCQCFAGAAARSSVGTYASAVSTC
jgi:hypothetical protein